MFKVFSTGPTVLWDPGPPSCWHISLKAARLLTSGQVWPISCELGIEKQSPVSVSANFIQFLFSWQKNMESAWKNMVFFGKALNWLKNLPKKMPKPTLHISALTRFSVGWTRGFTSKRYLAGLDRARVDSVKPQMNQNRILKYGGWLRNPAPPKGWLKPYII